MIGVLAELPVGHEPLEPLDLIALLRQEGVDEVAADHVAELGIGFECVQRVGEAYGKHVR